MQLASMILAFMASTALAMPAPTPVPTAVAEIDDCQISFTIAPEFTSASGIATQGLSAAAALTGVAAGDLAGDLVEGPSVTAAAGEVVGTLGPFQGELQGSIYDGPDGTTLGGCADGAAGPFGYIPCFNLPVPKRTAEAKDQ